MGESGLACVIAPLEGGSNPVAPNLSGHKTQSHSDAMKKLLESYSLKVHDNVSNVIVLSLYFIFCLVRREEKGKKTAKQIDHFVRRTPRCIPDLANLQLV